MVVCVCVCVFVFVCDSGWDPLASMYLLCIVQLCLIGCLCHGSEEGDAQSEGASGLLPPPSSSHCGVFFDSYALSSYFS